MRHLLVAALSILVACDPPPIEEGAPTLEILFPPDNPTICLSDDDESLEMLVVVRIDNLELVEIPATDHVDGEGHWHLTVDGDYVPTDELFGRYPNPAQTDPLKFSPGDTVFLSADIVQNDHKPYKGAINDVREFTVKPFGTKDCDNN